MPAAKFLIPLESNSGCFLGFLLCLLVIAGPGPLWPASCFDWGIWARFYSEPGFKSASQVHHVNIGITMNSMQGMCKSDTVSLRWSSPRQGVHAGANHCLPRDLYTDYRRTSLLAWLFMATQSVYHELWEGSHPSVKKKMYIMWRQHVLSISKSPTNFKGSATDSALYGMSREYYSILILAGINL